jgi:hypothetical protein
MLGIEPLRSFSPASLRTKGVVVSGLSSRCDENGHESKTRKSIDGTWNSSRQLVLANLAVKQRFKTTIEHLGHSQMRQRSKKSKFSGNRSTKRIICDIAGVVVAVRFFFCFCFVPVPTNKKTSAENAAIDVGNVPDKAPPPGNSLIHTKCETHEISNWLQQRRFGPYIETTKPDELQPYGARHASLRCGRAHVRVGQPAKDDKEPPSSMKKKKKKKKRFFHKCNSNHLWRQRMLSMRRVDSYRDVCLAARARLSRTPTRQRNSSFTFFFWLTRLVHLSFSWAT